MSLRLLDELVAQDPPPEGVAEQLVALARSRQNAGWERLGGRRRPCPFAGSGDAVGRPGAPAAADDRGEREELLRWRDDGRLDDDSRRELERELDYEEGLLPET